MRKDRAMESGAPVRVLQVIARMNVGGPAVLVSDLMRNLDRAKFEAKLLTGYCDENEPDYLNEIAVDVVATRIPGLGRSISIFRDLMAFFLIVKEIKRFKPDVIHTHTAKAGVLGRLAGFIARPSAKRVHTVHGHLLYGYFSRRKVRLIVLIERLLGIITHKYVAIGTHVKNDLINAGVGGPEKYEVIYPGLQDLDLHSLAEARKTLGLAPEKCYVVFVGRLTHIKRPDRLMDLARMLKVDAPSTHLLIAGAGELLDKLKEMSEKESLPITFLGWRNDIGMILCASNIAVLCSDNEGIPLTLIQASQAGLPIVSTNVGSVSDIVVEGETGLLTSVTSDALTTGVSSLLKNPALREQLGKSGQKRARELFSSRVMIEHHEILYSQLL
jgi:glycosyltransferase involved in cell wall biosynthesis